MEQFFSTPIATYLVIPLLVALARVVDVTLGTMRIVFVARGDKLVAPLLGFFEVFIWIIAIGQVMQHATNLVGYAAYAAGFAMGNYVGLSVEEKLAVGTQMVRFMLADDYGKLSAMLKGRGMGSTHVQGEGAHGPVHIVYTIVPRRAVKELLASVREVYPGIFYTVEDVRTTDSGVFPRRAASLLGLKRGQRSGK